MQGLGTSLDYYIEASINVYVVNLCARYLMFIHTHTQTEKKHSDIGIGTSLYLSLNTPIKINGPIIPLGALVGMSRD